jgi:glycosyltransferase involved in cell wall biosynthesis
MVKRPQIKGLPALASEAKVRAAKAMAARQWRAAATAYRSWLGGAANLAGRVQFGHALKEAGFLSLAQAQYDQGFADRPLSLEAHCQAGHLSKVGGAFEAAAGHYQRALILARAAGDADAVREIEGFLKPVEELRARPVINETTPAYFISTAAPEMAFSDPSLHPAKLGKANYSYGLSCRGFLRAFEARGTVIAQTAHPEYVPAPRPGDARLFHVAFGPPGQARIMKGAYNVIHFAWEFPRIPTAAEELDVHPFRQFHRMIDAFDEVWLPSRFAVEVIAPLMDKPVRFAPSPIVAPTKQPRQTVEPGAIAWLARRLDDLSWAPLSIFPRLQSNFDNFARSRARTTPEVLRDISPTGTPQIFLTVVNPHDKRKQLKPLLDAFSEYALSHPDAVLLIKTSSPDDTNETINRRIFSHQLNSGEELVHPYVSDRIWFCNQALSDSQMTRLYSLASFYICTSFCEGQNLPLLEAMARGCVPVSVDHTAMADYITPDNAVVIASRPAPASRDMRRVYGMYGFDTNLAPPEAVSAALAEAGALSDEAYLVRSKAAWETVVRLYDEDVVIDQLDGYRRQALAQ